MTPYVERRKLYEIPMSFSAIDLTNLLGPKAREIDMPLVYYHCLDGIELIVYYYDKKQLNPFTLKRQQIDQRPMTLFVRAHNVDEAVEKALKKIEIAKARNQHVKLRTAKIDTSERAILELPDCIHMKKGEEDQFDCSAIPPMPYSCILGNFPVPTGVKYCPIAEFYKDVQSVNFYSAELVKGIYKFIKPEKQY